MSDNSHRTHLAVALDAAARQRAADGDQLQGKGIPCKITKIVSSNMVEVEFQIKGPYTLPRTVMAVQSEEYARVPHQVGDPGLAVPLDFYTGGITGLGGGTADYVQRSNLTNMRFQAVGRKNLPGNVDLNAYNLYGKNGVVLYDLDSDGHKHAVVTLTPQKITIDVSNTSTKLVEIKGKVTIGLGSTTLDVNSDTGVVTLTGDLHVTGAVIAGFGGADQVGLQTHLHHQPNDSHGDAEQPTDPPEPGT